MRYLVTSVVVCALTTMASAAVVVGTTETFDASATGGAVWGVGGPDGWQVLWADQGNNSHREVFGSVGQIVTMGGDFPYQYQESRGQPDPGSHSGEPGTLCVEHMSQWDGGGDPTGAASKQMQYITFQSVAGLEYKLSAWVNTTQMRNPAEWVDAVYPAGDKLGGHPRTVSGMASHYADIQIGLKLGAADASDLDTVYTQVGGLKDNLVEADAWVQTPELTVVGDGGPMTVILKLRVADGSAGAQSDLDVRWDDILLTPEPASLALLASGLLLVRRRR